MPGLLPDPDLMRGALPPARPAFIPCKHSLFKAPHVLMADTFCIARGLLLLFTSVAFLIAF